MKNILVNFLGRKGGTALYSYEMTKGLIENGANVYAIVSKQNEMLLEWKKLPLKKLIVIPTYTNKYNFILNSIIFFLINRFKVKSLIKKLNIDVIYVPCFHPWFRFIDQMKPNTKKIITVHDPIPHSGSFFKNKLIWLLQKKDLIRADEIVVLSNIFVKYIMNKYKKEQNQVHVIPHGVFNYYKNVVPQIKYNLYDDDKINFLFFGRIEPYKGLNILGQAYKEIENKYKNVSLTIAGNGDFSPYERYFSDLKNFKLINRWIKDEEVNRFFQGKNVVTVLPYLNATQSGVISIAMINKSLIIATNTGGIKEQIQNKETGLLVEPDNKGALIEMMKYCIEHKNECNKYIKNAEKHLKKLDWKNLSKILLNIIEK